MKSLFKVLLGIFGTLIVLVIALAIALPLIYDTEDMKVVMADQARKQTGRELSIGGDLNFSVFPWLAVEVFDLELGNAPGFGDQPFARIEEARIGVALIPLCMRLAPDYDLVIAGVAGGSLAYLIGRLVRIFRVLRMVSIIPELRTLLNSLLAAMPQLGYVMLMMFIIFYIYAAVGTTFFADINPTLWGDITISMLTLFRVMTFEDWTDVMYETMAVYPLSWSFYLSFIFLSAFAFLNMIIGIVVNVLEEEHQRQAQADAIAAGEPTLTELRDEIRSLRSLLEQAPVSAPAAEARQPA